MKIAIQGHLTKGKEVIQILESLGGKNVVPLQGTDDFYYYIDESSGIYCHDYDYINKCKKYTLEEFEKEFPFKVGDIVSLKGTNDSYEVIALVWYMNKLCYKLDNGLHYNSNTLTTYEKMKEKRHITLTLDKAKDWFKKGGELKEVALQAYSEEELTKVELPKTWEEFCDNYMIDNSEAYFDTCGEVYIADKTYRHPLYDKNMCPSKKSAEAHLAMMQLEQLRNCWRQGWKPNWNNIYQSKFCINLYQNTASVHEFCEMGHFLSFPTREMAKEFLKCFRDLIEKAGDLI